MQPANAYNVELQIPGPGPGARGQRCRGKEPLSRTLRSTEGALGLRNWGRLFGGKGACNGPRRLAALGGGGERAVPRSQLWALGPPDQAQPRGPQECVFTRGEGDGDRTRLEMRLTQSGQLPENSVQSTRETHLRKQNCESNFEALVAMGTYL